MVSTRYRVGQRNSTYLLYDDNPYFDVLRCNKTRTKGARNSRVIFFLFFFFLGGGGWGEGAKSLKCFSQIFYLPLSRISKAKKLKNFVKLSFLRI